MYRGLLPIIRMMRKNTFFLPVLLCCLWAGFSGVSALWAQEVSGEAAQEAAVGGEIEAENADEGALPRKFREIELGMTLDDLKISLQNDSLFNFRGDRDVSLLPSREQSLVETTGPSFIRRAFFQLRDGELFIMAFSLNTSLVDHYSVFTGFVKKYGEPSYLDPREAVWDTEETRIAIERPLTVKYVDKRVFNDILSESEVTESHQARLRQEFLDEF